MHIHRLACSPPILLECSSPKFVHDIVALVSLFNHVYTQRYPFLFLNAIATKVWSLPYFSQNWLPWQRPLKYQKRGPDRSSAPKTLSFGEKIAKIGPVDPEIIFLREIVKDKKETERNYRKQNI